MIDSSLEGERCSCIETKEHIGCPCGVEGIREVSLVPNESRGKED